MSQSGETLNEPERRGLERGFEERSRKNLESREIRLTQTEESQSKQWHDDQIQPRKVSNSNRIQGSTHLRFALISSSLVQSTWSARGCSSSSGVAKTVGSAVFNSEEAIFKVNNRPVVDSNSFKQILEVDPQVLVPFL